MYIMLFIDAVTAAEVT